MNLYKIKCITNSKQENFYLKVESIDDIFKYLDKNVIILKLTKLPLFFYYFINFFKPKGTIVELIEFLKNLSLMLNSGISFNEILEDMKQEQKSKAIQDMLYKLEISLNNGNSISDTLRLIDWIPEIVPNMISIGEQNGKLSELIEKCYLFLEKTYKLKKNMKSAMIYPITSIFFVLNAFMFWLIYVLPKMVEFFNSMNMKIPKATQYMINLSEWLRNNMMFQLVIIGVVFLIVYIFIKRPKKIAAIIDKMYFKIPLIGKIIQYYNTAYISESITLYIKSGFGMFESLKSLKDNTTNHIYKDALEYTMKEIIEGKALYQVFQETNVFPNYMIRMLKAGEKTGEIEQQLTYVSKKYFEEIEYIAANIQKIISPFIMIFVALFIVIILMMFIGPLDDSFSNLR